MLCVVPENVTEKPVPCCIVIGGALRFQWVGGTTTGKQGLVNAAIGMMRCQTSICLSGLSVSSGNE
jgi:hypothetical protein